MALPPRVDDVPQPARAVLVRAGEHDAERALAIASAAEMNVTSIDGRLKRTAGPS